MGHFAGYLRRRSRRHRLFHGRRQARRRDHHGVRRRNHRRGPARERPAGSAQLTAETGLARAIVIARDESKRPIDASTGPGGETAIHGKGIMRSDPAPSVDPASWALWRDRRGRLSWLRIAALALLLFPLAKAASDWSGIAHGARPINDLIHRAGFWTLSFLGVTLAVTPFRSVAGYGMLVAVRRMLGVGTICFAASHVALNIADQGYDPAKFLHELTH